MKAAARSSSFKIVNHLGIDATGFVSAWGTPKKQVTGCLEGIGVVHEAFTS